MKVVITHTRELNRPHLKLDLDLDTGNVAITIKHTCSDCAGYGCHGKGCDDSITLKPEEVVPTLGLEAKNMLRELLLKLMGDS